MSNVPHPKDLESGLLTETEVLKQELRRLRAENQTLKNTQQTMEIQQELLSFGEEITHTATWMWNPEKNTLTYSDQLLKLYEFDKEEVTAENIIQKIFERIHPEDIPTIPIGDETGITPTQLPFEFHFRAIMPNQEIKWIRIKNAKVLDDGGIVGISQDITLNKQLESLKTERKILLEGEKGARMGSFIWNTDTNKVTYSQGLVHVLDLEGTDVNTENLFDKFIERVHPEDIQLVYDGINLSKGSKVWIEKEYRILDRYGDARYLRVRCKEYKFPHLIVGVFTDISAEKEIEEKVSHIQKKLNRQRKLMMQGEELAKMGTYTQYLDTEEFEVSPAFLEIFEIPLDKNKSPDLLEYFYTLVHPDDIPILKDYSKRKHSIYKEKKVISIEYRVVLPGNRIKWVLSRNMAGDKPNIVLGTMQDITEAKMFNLMLEETQKELEQFIYTVSHDLRAPIRHILSYSQWLDMKQADKLSEQGQDILQYVIKAAERMGRMVDKLLDYSRTRNLVPNLKKVNLNKLVKDICQKLDETPDLPPIKWEIDPMPRLFADKEMTRQVFENLLSNAVKFSSKREEIQISISVASNEEAHSFTIKDNGVGFDPKYQHKLFGIFQRLHDAEEFPGSGIGLASVQKIIHLHGGEIWAKGELDEGATFTFSFPTH